MALHDERKSGQNAMAVNDERKIGQNRLALAINY